MKKKIHVNQHHIKANNKGDSLPVLTVKTYKGNSKANEAWIKCDCCGNIAGILKYSPDKPLSCGAKVWLETDEKVFLPEMDEWV
ncbi:MAG: hypothetical protein CML33_09435 [Rhodobacteraceae bacterium]|nr:hypothetical protein [Paracoccaceae bacterium]